MQEEEPELKEYPEIQAAQVSLDIPGQLDALDFRETPVKLEQPELPEPRDLSGSKELRDPSVLPDQMVQLEIPDRQVLRDPVAIRETQESMVSTVIPERPEQLVQLGQEDRRELRVIQEGLVNLVKLEVRDLQGVSGRPVSRVHLE